MHLNAYDVAQEEEDEQQEREADRFASEFLMPSDVFWDEWEEARGRPLVERVFKLKQIFRVSYRTVLYRVAEETSDRQIWGKFYSQYKRRTGNGLAKTDEPGAIDLRPRLPRVLRNRNEPNPPRSWTIDFGVLCGKGSIRERFR